MNPFSDNFLNYEDIPLTFEKLREDEFSITSPDSDSTAYYANSASPNTQQYFPPQNPSQQAEYYAYSEDYLSSQRNIVSYNMESAENFYTKAEQDDKALTKNKRSAKRQIAKERTKTKQDFAALLEGIDSKFIPEGFDDPNLDEKTKKKMIQMVRNRISAQNSRDRKKTHMLKLEDINHKLMSEKDALMKERTVLLDEIQRLQQANNALYEENQTLKNGNVCSICRRTHSTEPGQNEDDHQLPSTEESLQGGFSGLNSPVLQRFASGGRGFMTFFAFAALVSLVVVMNVQQSNTGIAPDNNNNMDFPKQRFLEGSSNVCKNPDDMPEIKVESLDYSYSLILRNIKPITENFKEKSSSAFKAHMDKTMLNESELVENTVQLSDPRFLNAVVKPDYFKPSFLRRSAAADVESLNLPIVSQNIGETSHTSTLFCHNGMEFFENQDHTIPLDGEKSKIEMNELYLNGSLDLEKADFLQLIVPRKSVTRLNIKNNISGVYEVPEPSSDETNSVLEVWCKVFYVRELGSA